MRVGDGWPHWTCGACGLTVSFNAPPELHALRRTQLIHARAWCRPAPIARRKRKGGK